MNTVSITDLRQDATKIIDKLDATGEPTYILQNSNLKAVLLDAEYYETLQEALEDYQDVLDSKKALAEGGLVPFADVHAAISHKTSKKRPQKASR